MVDEVDPLAELAIQKWAENWGMDPKLARERYLPILTKKKPSGGDKVAEGLMQTMKLLEQLDQAKRNASESTKRLIDSIGAGLVMDSVSGKRRQGSIEEDMDEITRYIAKMKAVERAFGSGDVDKLSKRIDELQEIIHNQRKSQELEELKQVVLNTVKPLQEEIEKLKHGNTTAKSPEEIMDLAVKQAEAAEKYVKAFGKKVVSDRGITEAELEERLKKSYDEWLKSLAPDQAKKRLEEAGYKVVGGPVPYEQVEKMIRDAIEKAKEDRLEEKKIDAFKDVISDAVSGIISLFKPAVEVWSQIAVEDRAKSKEVEISGQPPTEEKPSK